MKKVEGSRGWMITSRTGLRNVTSRISSIVANVSSRLASTWMAKRCLPLSTACMRRMVSSGASCVIIKYAIRTCAGGMLALGSSMYCGGVSGQRPFGILKSTSSSTRNISSAQSAYAAATFSREHERAKGLDGCAIYLVHWHALNWSRCY
jgi:hypothetical protein